ncbi:MAG TPA: Fic family protein [Candidatus Kapabacteria bacterium]|nr:Fic family protein [Candidatus Kapabacteria bacterium]
MGSKRVIERVDALRAEIDSLRPLESELEGRILQKFRLDWNYHSSNIEGNSLTFGETKTFLLHGLTAQGKPLRDHLEIRGHNEAIDALGDIVAGERELTEHVIKSLHQIILGETYTIPARTPDGVSTERLVTPGRYKLEPNHVRTVTGEMFYFAPPEKTPEEMEALLTWYRGAEAAGMMHPVAIGARLHYGFIRIHPFDDGNGRMARILMNLVLMKHGYPPAIVRTEEKEEYYRALRQADGGNVEAFIAYVGRQLWRSCDLYLRAVRGDEVEDEADIDRKIALFKARAVREPEFVFGMHWTPATSDAFYDSILFPIIEYVFAKLSKFDDLFALRQDDAIITVGMEEIALGEIPLPGEGALSMLYARCDAEQEYSGSESVAGAITAAVCWRGYRYSGVGTFDIGAGLRFALGDDGFELYTYPSSILLLEKRYASALLADDLRRVASRCVDDVIAAITLHIESDG